MGDFNRSVIFDAIRREPEGRSRVELVEITGLSTQTVSNIARRLLDDELIVEAGKTSAAGLGKPRTILRLNPAGLYAAGVHIDPAVMTYVLLDLTGRVVAHARDRTPEASNPEQVMAHIRDHVERLVADSGIAREKLVGLGLAAPGPIDQERGTIVDPPNLRGWHSVPLRDALEDATGLPVLVDKDVTAAAVAETWVGGASGTGSFVFLYLGTGIGAGLALGDELMRGVSGNAGEIGHIVADPDGPPCACGQRGCIAVTITPQAMVEEAERLGVLRADAPFESPPEIDAQFARLCTAAEAGDTVAGGILDRAADRTARAVAVITNLLDVDRVVFGGPFWARLEARYLERVPPRLAEYSATIALRELEVVGTGVGEDVAAIGAASLVLERTFAPTANRLLLG
ncbi:ROK family protein [Agromyces lapidis]|uniref:ROK family protein n=1 Tax=Agromyces lapidis TaxID=279574 RepID=A0ABV5SLW8_9MICO|nr:ROK family protein [Agromyces lapidis]